VTACEYCGAKDEDHCKGGDDHGRCHYGVTPAIGHFDITDGRNRYEPCPGCGSLLDMGLTSRKGFVFVWCPHCNCEGPHIQQSYPLTEADRLAFNAWNSMKRT
jgi:hypothetical protein